MTENLLKEFRKNEKLTQVELSLKLNVTQGCLSKLEHSNTLIQPWLKVLWKLDNKLVKRLLYVCGT